MRFAGYAPLEAGHGDLGLRMATERSYDLLLLDLVLPGRDGLEILQAVRALRPTQPVILLTARGDESDRVAGLRLGADDYVVKPFSVKELLARVEAVLRRSPERPQEVTRIKLPEGVADLARSEVRVSRRRARRAFGKGSRIACAIWRPIRAARSRATNCCCACGESARADCRRARSICMSRDCVKNFATIRPSRRSC